MKHFVKVPLTLETPLSCDDIKEKIDNNIAETKKLSLYKYKGQPMWFWFRSENEVSLRYCESYKSDMCDIVFEGNIKNGLSGCQIDGFIKKPTGIWGIFWVVAILTVLVTIGLSLVLSLNPDIPLYEASPLLVFLLPVAYIEAQLMMFDTKRLRAMNEKLRTFTLAENIDLIEDEYNENEASTDSNDSEEKKQ